MSETADSNNEIARKKVSTPKVSSVWNTTEELQWDLTKCMEQLFCVLCVFSVGPIVKILHNDEYLL